MWGTRIMLLLAMILGHWSQPIDSLRILSLFPLNSKSHYAMCDRLAKGLAARGHQVDVYGHYPPKKPIANYNYYSLEGTLPSLTNKLNYSTAAQLQAQNAHEVLKTVGTPSCKLMQLPIFEKLLKETQSYDLVIVEAFIADCYFAWGRHLDVPMIGVMTTAMIDWYNEALANPFNTAVTPSAASTLFPPMNFWQRLRNTVVGTFVAISFTRAIADNQNQLVKDLFGSEYPDVNDLRRDLDLLLVNWHYSLEGVRAYTPAVVPVAGMHITDEDGTTLPTDIQKWLDDSKRGCIYFSFGSMLKIESFPKSVINEFYATFRNIAPVRVLLKIADPKDLPAELPANVMIQSWFPQLQILKHKNTKAFVTHGGLMSSLESIQSGVPMIGIPIFGDQHSNVQVNVKKGIATSVELATINAEKLTAAINQVLRNPLYKQNIEKVSRVFMDRPMKPLDTAIFWIEYVSRHGRKCLRSPLVDMPWWQANLLDVYVFIFSIILSICFIFKFFIRKVYSLCCSKQTNNSSRKEQFKKKQ